MYFVITGLHSLTLVSTFGFLPKKFISRPETPKIHKEVAESGGAGVELLNGEKNPGIESKNFGSLAGNAPHVFYCHGKLQLRAHRYKNSQLS